MFEDYFRKWNLQPDGEEIITSGARLLPVRQGNAPAMLKIAVADEEKAGIALMQWWKGKGAVTILAADGEAVLMERATGRRSLSQMAHAGEDMEATRIICDVVKKLHGSSAEPPLKLMPLGQRFRELQPASRKYGGFLQTGWWFARDLLAEQREVQVLHGDIHHGNILDFGPRGWLAIDPKGGLGERYFDYANIFTNPDLATGKPLVATVPENFRRRLGVVVAEAGLERNRLLRWIVAWCALSAAWFLNDGIPADINNAVAELALAELAEGGCQPSAM